MICFEVTLNGTRLATSGLPGGGVLNASVDLLEPSGPGASTRPRRIFLHVGGLDSSDPLTDGEHVDWVDERPLSVGDTVTIQVLARDSFDPPIRRKDSMTHEELKEDQSKSARYYLGHYRKQQVAIEKQIRVIENFLAKEKAEKSDKSRHKRKAPRRKAGKG